jgi:chemotaxis protein MotB
MRAKNITLLVAISLAVALFTSGCVNQREVDDLKVRNRNQQQRIDELESQLNVAKLKMSQLEKQLADCQSGLDTDIDALNKKIALLEEDIAKKEALIKQMQGQLGGSILPPELASELQKFAAENPDMVTFDEATGMVKFKSDLLFQKGSDVVAPEGVNMLKKFSEIINSQAAEGFDVTIVGHTDDMPIKKSETMSAHPTNWHLSVHRAIAVEKVMESASVNPKRMGVKGYGEYRPIEANEAGNKGNAKNRRVELYLVPAGSAK